MNSELKQARSDITPEMVAEAVNAFRLDKAPREAMYDAIAAALAVKPAAAQEAAAEVLSCRVGNDTSTIDKALPIGTKLYAAPVIAAPGIDLAGKSGLLRRARSLFDQDREYALERGDSLHAGQCTRDIAAIDALIDAGKSNCWPEGSYAESVERLMGMSRGERDAIGARPVDSPKGGSDWEATDADIAAWQQRHDLTGAFGSKTDARAAFEDARSAERAAGDAEVQPLCDLCRKRPEAHSDAEGIGFCEVCWGEWVEANIHGAGVSK